MEGGGGGEGRGGGLVARETIDKRVELKFGGVLH